MNKFVNPLFIDSGAHGLYAEYVQKNKDKSKEGKYKWYTTKPFYDYIDTYIEFIKKYKHKIDLYANVDVIFNPELTWQAQMYCEKNGITPVPVIHFNTPMKWLQRYLTRGYEYIALGGLGQEAHQTAYKVWADQAFDIICDQPSRLPKVKVHGFAVTAIELMRRYPWYSVDSTTFINFAAYGQILVPPKVNGKWDYGQRYLMVRVSEQESKTFNKTAVGNSYKEKEVNIIMEYLNEKGFVLGKSKIEDGKVIKLEPGLCNDDAMRAELNALYFIDFTNSLPKWPWAFYRNKNQKPNQKPMI